MSNTQLTHDFLKWLIDNYGIQLIMSENDADVFEQLYPDLTEQLEKKNEQ